MKAELATDLQGFASLPSSFFVCFGNGRDGNVWLVINCQGQNIATRLAGALVNTSQQANDIFRLTNDGVVSSCSKTIFIDNLGHHELTLRRPLPLRLEITDSQVIAYSYDLDELGVGECEADALEQIKAAIVESYFLLKEEQANLGPLQAKHWGYLNKVIG